MQSLLKPWRLDRFHTFVLLLLPCAFLFTVYFVFTTDSNYKTEAYNDHYYYELYLNFIGNRSSFEATKGYLVWNSKCQMLSMNPYDPSIAKFVQKVKFKACSTDPTLTRIVRHTNGSNYLTINQDAVRSYHRLYCCWAAISRPEATTKPEQDIDSKISVGTCQKFENRVLLDINIQALYVSCYETNWSTLGQVHYENTHAVVNPEHVRSRLRKLMPPAANLSLKNTSTINNATQRKPLSVLMLGIDSVSRLNFHRAMPTTRAYFENRGWIDLRGYNKMGDNTFPNLMAILSGHNQSWAYNKCKPTKPYGMDNCSMIWYNFRDAGYATAYAEDHAQIGTFNYLKVGFIEPPTDYYLRPYILASEKLLKTRAYDSNMYCTGPELSVDRVFDYAVEFAKAFIGSPYFGFFWTNTISHATMNGPSLYDKRFLAKLKDLEDSGVMNDSMIVVLSDHGMRNGHIRDTFIGWYEERLPFIYVWVPEWFREQNPESFAALRINQNRLTSPYDLYETLRDILQRAGGQAPASSGCPSCSSLFKPVPLERGCKEAGISSHWCSCAAFESYDVNDPIAIEGASKFVNHIENIVKQYKDESGNRLCSELSIKRIIQVKKMMDLNRDPDGKILKLFYLIEVTPGGGKFETTIRYNGPDDFTIRDDEVSRINLYGHSSRCLKEGYKQYCHCGS